MLSRIDYKTAPTEGSKVLSGYNSDIELKGSQYHVQTEDWGFDNPFIVSRIYLRGAVLRSIKTPYSDFIFRGFDGSQEIIKRALREQHQKILDLLLSGHL